MSIETPNIFKPPVISAEQMKDIVERVNMYRNGARNVPFTEEEIRTMITDKLRKNSNLKVEEAVAQIISRRHETIDRLNSKAA